MATNNTDDQNFKVDVLEAQEPVLVDFWQNGADLAKQLHLP